MNVIKDYLGSEKGVMALALLIAATVLAALGHLEIDAWIDYSKWIFGFFSVGTGLRAIGTGLGSRKSDGSSRSASGELDT